MRDREPVLIVRDREYTQFEPYKPRANQGQAARGSSGKRRQPINSRYLMRARPTANLAPMRRRQTLQHRYMNEALRAESLWCQTEGQIPQRDFFSHALNIYGIPPLLGSLASQQRASE